MKKFGVTLLLLLAACGKRGDPKPPVPIIPKATTDLVVTQRGDKIVLVWSYPSLTTAGQSLTNIRRVVVYRATETLPTPTPQGAPGTLPVVPGDVDPNVPRPIALFAKIPTLSNTAFGKLRDRVDSIEGSAFPAATVGARLLYEDSPPFQTSDGRPVRLTYAVVTETATAHGDISDLARIVPLPVPQPPTGITATAKPEGVVVAWTAPGTKGTGNSALPLVGYNVYRHPSNQEAEAIPTPVNAAPVTKTTYTDVPPYGDFTYVVRAVASAGPPRIESDPSAPATAKFQDLVPPPAVSNLTALVETRTLRLVWDPVTAADLAGYRVYRTEGSGTPLKPVAPALLFTPKAITATNWTDNHADPGISYFYEVTAIDKSGNESPRAKTDWVLVPKTP